MNNKAMWNGSNAQECDESCSHSWVKTDYGETTSTLVNNEELRDFEYCERCGIPLENFEEFLDEQRKLIDRRMREARDALLEVEEVAKRHFSVTSKSAGLLAGEVQLRIESPNTAEVWRR
jgi:hypothetical protein